MKAEGITEWARPATLDLSAKYEMGRGPEVYQVTGLRHCPKPNRHDEGHQIWGFALVHGKWEVQTWYSDGTYNADRLWPSRFSLFPKAE